MQDEADLKAQLAKALRSRDIENLWSYLKEKWYVQDAPLTRREPRRPDGQRRSQATHPAPSQASARGPRAGRRAKPGRPHHFEDDGWVLRCRAYGPLTRHSLMS